MNEILQAFYNLLKPKLEADSPVLSGNMRTSIETTNVSEHQFEIVINAPFYDMKEFNKTGNIVYTGLNWKGTGITDYAFWVNDIGAFGTHNKSQAWVNRTLLSVAKTIAAQYQIPQENIIMRLKKR